MGEIYSDLLKTLIAILTVVTIDISVELIFLKRIQNRRKKRRSRVVLRNALLIILLIFLAKIWVEGFDHFLAFIGFISAGLTITQKEHLLNLTAGLIIMWRDSFTEGDFIFIQDHRGIVTNLGIFFFTLAEIKPGSVSEKTGKIIKIPNSYIAQFPFSVFEFDTFVIYEKKYTFSFASNSEKLNAFVGILQDGLLEYVNALAAEYSEEVKKEYRRLSHRHKFKKPLVEFSISQEEPKGYLLKISGHCTARDENKIYKFLDEKIVEFAKDKSVELSS